MSYRIRGLDPAAFAPLFGLSDAALNAKGVYRYTVDARPGFPDRVTMTHMDMGEHALLLNHTHLPDDSPYRASHAIFVKEGATEAYDAEGEIPNSMRFSPLALRGIDTRGFILDADIAAGQEIEPIIDRFFDNPDIAYIHAHFAARGCFAGQIDRA